MKVEAIYQPDDDACVAALCILLRLPVPATVAKTKTQAARAGDKDAAATSAYCAGSANQ